MREFINRAKSLYEIDEHQWMLDQIALIEAKKFESLDYENLLQHLHEMSVSRKDALKSSFRLILSHMLKFLLQPKMATQSWIHTIVREQNNVTDYINDTPSLKNYQNELFSESYGRKQRLKQV